LHVFDFDSTLVCTLGPEEGKLAYERITGSPWPTSGWWGRPESLLPLPSRPGPALAAYRAALRDPQALVVLMTGRRVSLRAAVFSVLARHRATAFHAHVFNDGRLETLAHKSAALRALLGRHAGLAAVHIYEDRAEHAEAFRQLGAVAAPALGWRVHLVAGEGEEEAEEAVEAVEDAVGEPVEEVVEDMEAAGGAEAPRPTSPFIQLLHYARLVLPRPPAEAAALPPAWREAKRARDGDWPPAHMTLLTSAEVRSVAPDRPARSALARLLRRVRPQFPALLGVGVAIGREGVEAGSATAFIVCEHPGGAWLRRQLGLPRADFHITLGFDGTDPHAGVSKGRSALLSVPPGGWGAGEEAVQRLREAIERRVWGLRARHRRFSAAAGGASLG